MHDLHPIEFTHAATRLRLFGVPELQSGVPLRFLPERRFRLLAYLALRADWVGRDELAALFWPERGQDAARSNLRKLLLEVRTLAPPGLEDERSGLRWLIDTDVAEFRAALAAGDVAGTVARYRGPLLQSIDGGDSAAFDAWLQSARETMRRDWRGAALKLLPQLDAHGALALTRRLLEDDPYDEDAQIAQLDAASALGDAAAAAQAYRAYAERLIEALGVEPSARVRAAAVRASGGEQAAAPAACSLLENNGAQDFVGRARELDELLTLLARPDCRLLTVTGPGGVGKSRLVKQAVRQLAPRYADGVYWIALDDVTEQAQVALRIAAALGLDVGAKTDFVEALKRHLAAHQALLVLDNSEHLPQLARLVDALLAVAPRVQILSTSRARVMEPPGATAEWLLPLPGLGVPTADAAPVAQLHADAARLFVHHARRLHPRFDAPANAQHIGALVRAVGGLPLAILLAAAWVRVLPMSTLAGDVSHLLDVLERAEDGDERPEHRSVRATFERSWALLAPQEQQALAALSVFVGSFTREAARAVAEAPLPLLAALVDKSLAACGTDGRFSLHPLIQQFAAEKLADQGGREPQARDRHAEACRRFMEPYVSFDTTDQTAALDAIAAELPNLLAAWDWSIRRGHWAVLRTCASGISNYFQNRGPVRLGAELFARAHSAVQSAEPQEPAMLWPLAIERAALCYWLADYRQVESAARQALAAAREAVHPFAIRTSLNTLGLALMRLGRLAEGARYLEEALKRARDAHIAWEVAGYAGNLVAIKRESGDLTGARAMALEALAGHRAAKHRQGEVSMYNELGMIAHDLDACAEAIDWYEQGLRAAADYGLELRTVQLLSHQASACIDLGDVPRARTLGARALAIIARSGLHANEPTCRRVLALAEMAGGDADAARLQLQHAIEAARRIGTALVASPVLRDCALWLEQRDEIAAALALVAAADAHRISQALLLPRYRDQRARLAGRLGTAQSAQSEHAGAALTLPAALDEAARLLADDN
jgi:predicted ATPase